MLAFVIDRWSTGDRRVTTGGPRGVPQHPGAV